MALITAVTLPVAWVLMRNLLAEQQGWAQVGLWQGVTSISDAYLQFITATFSVWLLPTLARLDNKRDIAREIGRALRFVLPAVAVASWVSGYCAISPSACCSLKRFAGCAISLSGSCAAMFLRSAPMFSDIWLSPKPRCAFMF